MNSPFVGDDTNYQYIQHFNYIRVTNEVQDKSHIFYINPISEEYAEADLVHVECIGVLQKLIDSNTRHARYVSQPIPAVLADLLSKQNTPIISLGAVDYNDTLAMDFHYEKFTICHNTNKKHIRRLHVGRWRF